MHLINLLKPAYRAANESEVDIASSLSVRLQGDIHAKTKIVFLHGIASSRDNWSQVIEKLGSSFCLVTVDLLGFGESPVPLHANYSVETHAKAVLLSLKKAGVTGSFYLAGHSMGCLIGTHIATLAPKRVKGLYLVSIPIYRGWEFSEQKLERIEKILHRAYFHVYNYFCEDALFTSAIGGLLTRIVGQRAGFQLTAKNYIAFKRSLKNCIEFQTAEHELAQLDKPVRIYYGRFDIFVIKRYINELADTYTHIHKKRVISGHIINRTMTDTLVRDIRHDMKQGRA